MKFLIAFLLFFCFLIASYLFGRNVETNRDYLFYWMKSSLFTSVPIYFFYTKDDFDIFIKANFKAIIGGYLISLLLAIIFMAFMIFQFSYRYKYQKDLNEKINLNKLDSKSQPSLNTIEETPPNHDPT